MSGKRIKYLLVIVVLVAAGLALLASTQLWFTLTVSAGAGGSSALDVTGKVAAPALSALGFAGLALCAALAIAGPVIRVILAVLGIALGGSMLLSTVLAVRSPADAGASVVTAATGVSGAEPIRELVTSSSSTLWPILGIVAGVLLVLAALAVIITTRSWPSSSRKYQAVRLETADGTRPVDAVDEWDELSRGEDPTA